MIQRRKLEDQTREELLHTVRHILVEAETLSSRIVAVNEIGIAINRTLDISKILDVIAKQAKWLLDFEHCSVYMRDSFGDWSLKGLFGLDYEIQDHAQLQDSVIGEVIAKGQSRLINDHQNAIFLPDFPSKIIIPLDSEGEVIGTINFASYNQYSHEDLRIGYLMALQLSSAIRNAQRMEILHQTQDQLKTYARELELQNQELDAYSHTIAHDLKSPLSVIPMKAGLVKSYAKSLPPKVVKYLDDITERSKHMAEMIDQLLMLSKLRDNTQTLRQVNVNHIVRRSVARFPQIEMGNVAIHIQPDFPSILCHAQWLEEVFANLISNAIKYMGDDNPHPEIQLSHTQTPDHVCFSVTDNGIGIREEHQANLFKMFTRIHDVQTDGLGLGLSIVHRIVDRLGGQVGVDSQWGAGTTFWFTVPFRPTTTPDNELESTH